jgi:hypothetical protein
MIALALLVAIALLAVPTAPSSPLSASAERLARRMR